MYGRVLDYGCGLSYLAQFVKPGDYCGVDNDVETIQLAKKLYPEHKFFLATPTDAGHFDTIVSLAVIEHVKEPGALLHTFSSLLVEGGQIILTTPHPRADKIHGIGSHLGLFGREAHEQHETMLNKSDMQKILQRSDLYLFAYRPFLWHMNQLFIIRKKTGNDNYINVGEN